MKKLLLLVILLLSVAAYAEEIPQGGTPPPAAIGGTPPPAAIGGTPPPPGVVLGTPPPPGVVGGTPPCPQGGTPPPISKKGPVAKPEKTPRILVCTCASEDYATDSAAIMSCKYKANGVVHLVNLNQLYEERYRLIQIVETKDKPIYYFDKIR